MKTAVVCLIFLIGATAIPNGYYHQEYNYKTSASSFKNNELQRKTDDQGYYRKDGDLEGKTRPRIDSNSEHSEYVNPNLRNNQYPYSSSGLDLASAGQIRTDNGYGVSNTDLAEDIAANRNSRSGSLSSSGSYRPNTYGSGSYGSSSYGSNKYGSSSHSYGTSSSLRSLGFQIQQGLERELQDAIRDNNEYSNSRLDISELERDLRQNFTERLNNELISRYGQQSIRGGMSYSITGGRVQNTANYDNQELVDLRTQIENTLLDQLRKQYSLNIGSRFQNRDSSQYNYGYTSTTIRPVYHTLYPSLPSASYPDDYSSSNYQTPHNNYRYTPVSNPESISNIATRIQTKLDVDLNESLDEVNKKYFSSNALYSLTNTDVVLERIKNELRSNLTYLIDEDIRKNYGTQVERDGYMYSTSPNGQTSQKYNYAVRDLDNFKTQVEKNLLEKLSREFETQKSRWSTQQSYNSQSNYGSSYNAPRYNIYTTPRYDIYTTPSTTYPNADYVAPIVSNRGSANQYNYGSSYGIKGGAGSSHSSSRNSISSSSSSSSMAQLQRQLQSDLSRQLQAAINKEHFDSHSSSSDYSPQSFQSSLQQLQDELNRNLTRHLQEYSASGSYAAYGNFDESQMSSLKNQLESNLMRQLQQGLQQSFQSQSSYSGSSSSSSSGNYYRPVRGSQQLQYKLGSENMQGADCLGDEPNYRSKRSYKLRDDRSSDADQIELGQQIDNSDIQHEELGQQIDNSDLQHEELGQQIDNSDLQHEELGQQIDESDLIQQHEDSAFNIEHGNMHNQQVEKNLGFGKLQSGNQYPQTEGQLGQVSDSVQEIEDSGYGKLQTGNQYRYPGQMEDNLDITQNVEDSGFEQLKLSNQHETGQQEYNYQQTETEDLGVRKLQVENSHRQHAQNINHSGFGISGQGLTYSHSNPALNLDLEKLTIQQSQPVQQLERDVELSQQEQQIEFDQGEENSDFKDQHSKIGTGKLQIGSQILSQSSDVDLDEIVDRLERDLSIKLQELKNSWPTKSQADIQQFTRTLETAVIIPGKLNQQQLDYVKKEIEHYMLQALEKEFGTGFRYTSGWRTSQTNTYTFQGFRGDKYRDFNKKQIEACEDIESMLSAYITIAIKKIPLGLSNTDVQLQLQKLKNELYMNITNLLEEKHHLFTTVQSYKIQRQLKLDLTPQLDQLYRSEVLWNGVHSGNSELFGNTQNGNTQVTEKYNNLAHQGTFASWNIQGFDEKQVHFCQYLEDNLTKKLKDSINMNYVDHNNPNRPETELIYNKLLEEIHKNITGRLDGFSEYFLQNYMSFNQNKLTTIKKQLEYNLKLQLQKAIPLTSFHIHNQENTAPPQTIGIDLVAGDEQQNMNQVEQSDNDFTKLTEYNIENHQPEEESIDQNPNTQFEIQQSQEIDQTVQEQEPVDINTGFGNSLLRQFPKTTPTNNFDSISSQKPVSSNQFLQTEIEQQNTLNIQKNFKPSRPNLSTASQVELEQVPHTNNGYFNQQHSVTSQGQFHIQPQSIAEAEHTADSLIETLRGGQINREQSLNPVRETRVYGDINGYSTDEYTSHQYPYGNHASPDSYYFRSTAIPANHRLQNVDDYGYTAHGYGSPGSHSQRPTYGDQKPTVLNYATPQEIEDQNMEETSNIEPLYPISANENINPSRKPNYNVGVKGKRPLSRPSTDPNFLAHSDQVEVIIPTDTVEDVQTNNENLPWWKRLGNKVTAGANKLKEKIVG